MTGLRKTLRRTGSVKLPAILLSRSNIIEWIERRAQRRALAALDDRLLDDIGKTRAEALAEARKPFWRA